MFVANVLKSHNRLEAENVFFRHQLDLALRHRPPRIRFRGSGRAASWLSFPKISPLQIRVKRENQRIIRLDASDPSSACNVRRRPVQVAPQARSREPVSAPSAQHRLEADVALCPYRKPNPAS
jgi:hypothetical protein